MKAIQFQPVIGLRLSGLKVIRWGMMPNGKEKSLGVVGLVEFVESLRIYRAALQRTRAECSDYVVVQDLAGHHDSYSWEGEPT